MTLLLESPATTNRVVEKATRRVLFISYQFPPVGGAGVQRPVKFIKYLPEFGWEATVLTVANPSVPVYDESLLKELPSDLRITLTRTFEPGYAFKRNLAGGDTKPAGPSKKSGGIAGLLKKTIRAGAGLLLQPDPQMLWLPAALRAGTRLLKEVPHDAILATAPPYTSLLLGGLLKRRTGLPLILDYRDEWDLSSRYLENAVRGGWSKFVQERMQRWVLRQADAVVATTKASAAAMRERSREAGTKVDPVCIYNGFDREDFAHSATSAPETPRTRLRIVYTGTLWNLTSVAPMVEALERLGKAAPHIAEQIEFVAVGRKTPEQRAILDRIEATGAELLDIPYCEHAQALELLNTANVLCLLLSDVPGAERVVSAKMFEYFATGRPILAITPNGETSEIVSRFPGYQHFVPSDVSGIASWLEQRVREFQISPSSQHVQRPSGIDAFSRENLAGELAEVLDQVAQSQKGAR